MHTIEIPLATFSHFFNYFNLLLSLSFHHHKKYITHNSDAMLSENVKPSPISSFFDAFLSKYRSINAKDNPMTMRI